MKSHPRSWTVVASSRIYRMLMALYPRAFRSRFGAEMVQTFDELSRRLHGHAGLRGIAGLWTSTARDVATTVPSEHYQAWRSDMQRVETVASLVGYVGLAITASFVAVNVLQYNVGIELPWNPWDTLLDATDGSPTRYALDLAILFGPLVALAAFFLPMLKISFGGENEQVVTVVVRKTSGTKVALITVSLGVMAILGTYLIFENLPCFIGEQVTC